MIRLLLLVTLFIQTENGQVSVQKDLDAKTCKKILNIVKCRSNCMCAGLDENGDVKNLPIHTCSMMKTESDFKLGECIE